MPESDGNLGSIFVSSDGSLKPPGVPPGDTNRFSFRLVGTTGKWNPSRKPPLVLKSGDSVNIYCHSVGVGPYGSIVKPPAEASPVMKYTRLPENPVKLFVPVERTAFEYPDRDMIQKYDKGTLSQGNRSAFEKMGLITSHELAPGPTEIVETTKKRDLNVSFKAPGVSVGGGFNQGSTTTKAYTVIDGKRERIDYIKLQKPKYDQLDLDWGKARQEYFSSISDQPFGPEATLAKFTIQFE